MAKVKDKNWIQKMHMNKGALRRKTNTPEGENISQGEINKLPKTKKTKKQITLARNFANMNKGRA